MTYRSSDAAAAPSCGQVLSFATDWYWEGYYLASNYPADWQTHRKIDADAQVLCRNPRLPSSR